MVLTESFTKPDFAAGDTKKDDGSKSDPAVERLKVYAGLLKFMLGTVVLGTISLVFNEQYRATQLDLEKERSRRALELQERRAEVEYLSKFASNAMDKDIKVRVDFADYMKSVALSSALQTIWSRYFDVLTKKAQEAERQIKELEAKKQDATAKLTSVSLTQTVQPDTIELISQLQKIDRELYRIQDSLDRQRFGSFNDNFFDFETAYGDAATAGRAGNYARQRDLLVGAIEHVPKAVKPHFLSLLAFAYRALRDFPSASKAMQEAVSLQPSTTNLINLAIMQKNDMQVDLALQTLQNARKQAEPTDLTTIDLIIAGYLVHAGRRTEGIQRFESLGSKLQPRDKYITNIAWFYAVTDQKASFYEALEQALNVNRQPTLAWIDQEVDIDKYRDELHFKQLVTNARVKSSQE